MSLHQPVTRLRPVFLVSAMVVALALQTTVLNAVTLQGVKPDLVLVVALCAGLLGGPGAGAVYGAVAGLLEGYAQGSHLGSLGFSRVIGAFLSGTVETHILRDRVIVPMGTVFLGSLAAHAVYFVMAPELPASRPARIAVTESFLNALLALVVYPGLARWGRTMQR